MAQCESGAAQQAADRTHLQRLMPQPPPLAETLHFAKTHRARGTGVDAEAALRSHGVRDDASSFRTKYAAGGCADSAVGGSRYTHAKNKIVVGVMVRRRLRHCMIVHYAPQA